MLQSLFSRIFYRRPETFDDRVRKLPYAEQKRLAYLEMTYIDPVRAGAWPKTDLTEHEWLTTSDPTRLLYFLVAGTASNRKLRLFACACCRQIWHLMPDSTCRRAVEIVEQHPNSFVDMTEQIEAELSHLWGHTYWTEDDDSPRAVAMGACAAASGPLGSDAPRDCPEQWWHGWDKKCRIPASIWVTVREVAAVGARNREAVQIATESAQCNLLREIFGNPFQQVTLSPHCRTAEVLAIAEIVYTQRDFARLPELASELRKNGCDSKELLDHLRSDQNHVLGCWALDAVLDRD